MQEIVLGVDTATTNIIAIAIEGNNEISHNYNVIASYIHNSSSDIESIPLEGLLIQTEWNADDVYLVISGVQSYPDNSFIINMELSSFDIGSGDNIAQNQCPLDNAIGSTSNGEGDNMRQDYIDNALASNVQVSNDSLDNVDKSSAQDQLPGLSCNINALVERAKKRKKKSDLASWKNFMRKHLKNTGQRF